MAPQLNEVDLNLILSRTEGLWKELRGQRIFITGGTGFFGCWLIESFLHINRTLQLGAEATILTRDPAAFGNKCPHLVGDSGIKLLSGDVRNFQFPGGEYQYVIHAATENSAKRASADPIGLAKTILGGTERVLEFAASHHTRKFLFTSSGAVYGTQPASVSHIYENYVGAPDPLDNGSIYGEAKRAAEMLCTVYGRAHGIEIKVARCFAFVGPRLPLDAHFAIGNFIADAISGKSIRVNGDGTPLRSYMYAADLAIWLWTILFRGSNMEAFNVGSEQALSILELAHAVREALSPTAEVQIAQVAVPGTPVRQYVPSTKKAEQVLGLKCNVALKEAIRRTAAWHGHFSTLGD